MGMRLFPVDIALNYYLIPMVESVGAIVANDSLIIARHYSPDWSKNLMFVMGKACEPASAFCNLPCTKG
jgi:hypothetical protein